MLYSVLIYDSEALVDALTEAENQQRLSQHHSLQKTFRDRGDLGPVARLMPTTSAVTVKKGEGPPLVLDGPFAETKEQLVGFYLLQCDSLEEAIEAAQSLPLDSGALEVRPVTWFTSGNLPPS